MTFWSGDETTRSFDSVKLDVLEKMCTIENIFETEKNSASEFKNKSDLKSFFDCEKRVESENKFDFEKKDVSVNINDCEKTLENEKKWVWENWFDEIKGELENWFEPENLSDFEKRIDWVNLFETEKKFESEK